MQSRLEMFEERGSSVARPGRRRELDGRHLLAGGQRLGATAKYVDQ
jgi:hypothetical protein